jgi:hypothetical protein
MIKSQTVTFQSVEFRAVVSYATSPENFYVQLTLEDFVELFKRLNEHSIDSVDKKFWAYFHKPCLAPFNDGKCYQARIVADTNWYLSNGPLFWLRNSIYRVH